MLYQCTIQETGGASTAWLDRLRINCLEARARLEILAASGPPGSVALAMVQEARGPDSRPVYRFYSPPAIMRPEAARKASRNAIRTIDRKL